MSPAIPHSPAAERNKQPILEVLQRVLPQRGQALEVASGTGQHAVHFAAAMAGWTWQPTDPLPEALASIQAWVAQSGLPNIQPPLQLDVTQQPWPGVDNRIDAIFCANMIHIAPWSACEGLMSGAARHLAPHGVLVTYGPYRIAGVPTAASNLAFDADLRTRNPAWGLRRLEDVQRVGQAQGLALQEWVAMPANNFMLVFRRATASATTPGDA